MGASCLAFEPHELWVIFMHNRKRLSTQQIMFWHILCFRLKVNVKQALPSRCCGFYLRLWGSPQHSASGVLGETWHPVRIPPPARENP